MDKTDVILKHKKVTTKLKNKLRQRNIDVMFSSFPLGERNSSMSSEGTPHEASQSGQGVGRGSNGGTSHRDHDGGGGADLCNESIVKDGNSITAPIADRDASSMLKTELIPGSHGMSNS